MEIIDDLGRVIQLADVPKRIVSLVPSLTELLFDFGLENQIVGVTKFCVHPNEALVSKVKIGGTKKFDIEKIAGLQPDLILANKEENYQEGIDLLSEYPVFVSDINDLADAYRTINTIGKMTGKSTASEHLIADIQRGMSKVEGISQGKVLYLIWKGPMMVVGKSTFIDAVLAMLGFENAADHLSRYPALTEEESIALSPDYIFLSSEPFPFQEKHVAYYSNLFPDAKVVLVDGEMFSWYGSRLKLAPGYFEDLSNEISQQKI
jgi:ABC-type Fe3+-hydroxamate transport system substrate-binding protein